MTLPILSMLILLPIVGIFSIIFIQKIQSKTNAPRVALLTAGMHLTLTLLLVYNFDVHATGYQFVEKAPWIAPLESSYHLGVDGLSLIFILLTSFLTFVCFLHVYHVKLMRGYYVAFLLLQSFLVGIFCSLDLILFYFFFEAVLIPMFLIIGIWGGQDRIYATFKFFLYTLVGSVLVLVAFIVLYYEAGNTNLLDITTHNFSFQMQCMLWVALFIGFAVKTPMWPLHTWLPDAHVEAPTAGSMMLAGILLKLGGYGMLRFCLPLLPDASFYFSPFVYVLSVIAIVYASLVALVQKDMKKLIAYSSVAHMGFVTLGIFTFNTYGTMGAIVQMISHCLTSSALFFCVGVVYERFHTREIAHYGGLAKKMPYYAIFFLLFILASIGFPGTLGFLGEFLVILGSFQVSPTLVGCIVLGVILSAAYGLWLYRRIMYEKLNTQFLDIKSMFDLKTSEKLVLGFLFIPVLFLGVYPSPLTSILIPYTDNLLSQYQRKRVTQKQNLWNTLVLPSQSISKVKL